MELQESVQRILQDSEAFAERFYSRYLECHPEAGRFFTHLDMKRQAVMLNMALVLVAHHAQYRYPATENYLRVLGRHHHARQAIPQEMFAGFNAVLLEALADYFGPDWDAALASQWRGALELGTALMMKGYVEDN